VVWGVEGGLVGELAGIGADHSDLIQFMGSLRGLGRLTDWKQIFAGGIALSERR
jgi:hypothetical protein